MEEDSRKEVMQRRSVGRQTPRAPCRGVWMRGPVGMKNAPLRDSLSQSLRAQTGRLWESTMFTPPSKVKAGEKGGTKDLGELFQCN